MRHTRPTVMGAPTRLLNWYLKTLVLGTVIHELAHALTVKLCGGTINEIDITSHVNHSGNYNLFQQIAISYAPVVVNTALATALAVWAVRLPTARLPQEISAAAGGRISAELVVLLLQLVVFILAFVIAAKALPSYTDAKNPFTTFRRQLSHPTPFRIVTAPIALLLLLIGVLPLLFAYFREKSALLHILTEVTFAAVVVLQATGAVVVVDLATLEQAGEYLLELW